MQAASTGKEGMQTSPGSRGAWFMAEKLGIGLCTSKVGRTEQGGWVKLASVGVRELCPGHSRHLCLGGGLAAWIMGLALVLDPWMTLSTNTPCNSPYFALLVCQQMAVLAQCVLWPQLSGLCLPEWSRYIAELTSRTGNPFLLDGAC